MSSERPLSILHILEKNRFNTGSVHQMFQAAKGLAGRGHRVGVVSRSGGELESRCASAGLDFIPLPLRNEFDLGSARQLSRILADRNVDVVHVHKVSFPLDPWMRPKYKLRRIHKVVTVCEDIRKVIIASGKLPPDKVRVVYAGVDLELFDPGKVDGTTIRREFSIPADAFLICQIGAREWKGWRYLIEAMPEIVRSNPKAHLLLVACKNGEQIIEVKAYAEKFGVGGQVTPVGFRSDVPALSAALDVALDLSYEGLGVTGTLREAMAMNKPCVCSNAGGNPELVLDQKTGFLVEPKSASAAARAIIALAGDPEKCRRFGLAGRKRVEEGFSSEIRITRLEQLYREVLATGR